jgi:hypothetical protein
LALALAFSQTADDRKNYNILLLRQQPPLDLEENICADCGWAGGPVSACDACPLERASCCRLIPN